LNLKPICSKEIKIKEYRFFVMASCVVELVTLRG